VKVSDDGMKARIVVDGLRPYFLHTIILDGVREKEHSYSLVHPTAFYTLNNIPDGPKLAQSELSTQGAAPAASANRAAPAAARRSTPARTGAKPAASAKPAAAQKSAALAKAPTYDEVKGLLAKHTCLACHNTNTRQVGPAYIDVAKRNYSNERIVKLIHSPEPQNWPDYATEMPPMPQVPKEDALKIAQWINSLLDDGNASVK
jgi:cytochrome c551/c552